MDEVSIQPVAESKTVREGALAPLGLLTAVYIASFALPLPLTDGSILHLPSVCLFFHWTGLPCPGCGLTRAFVCIAHGRFVEAVHWHPLGPGVFLVGIAALMDCAYRVAVNRPLFRPSQRVRSSLTWGAGGIFLGFGILRAAYFAANHLRF